MSNRIPMAILNAANNMLEPYGVNVNELLNARDAPPVKPLEKAWLTTDEAVKYTGAGRWTLWRAQRAGKIKMSKLSPERQGKILFERVSLDNWLKGCCKNVSRTGDNHAK